LLQQPATTAAPGQQDYNVELRKLDYRAIAGLRYTINKAVIGLTYQHGLKPVGKGVYTSTDRNHQVAVSLLWKIK
jgi:hypothetical protein